MKPVDLPTYLWWIFQMAKLDSADNILDDDDIQFCRNYLFRTDSIADNGKHTGNAVLVANSSSHATNITA